MKIQKILKTRKHPLTVGIIMHVGLGDVLLMCHDLGLEDIEANGRTYQEIFSEFGSTLDQIAQSK